MLDDLNAAQREVAELRGHCAAVACPGAGKTKTIAVKAATLLADPHCTVGAVTFNKDAAEELRSRILTLTGPAAKNRLLAGTFHALAFRQLSANGSRRQDIATDGDRLALVAQALKEAELGWKEEDAIASIEQIKTGGGRVAPGTPEERLYQAYQHALERNGKLDFQDMLRLAVDGMEAGSIAPYAFSHLLVDEFQDADPLQYRWVALHAKAGSVVTVVADDDQSIYGFRSALGYRGLESFIKDFGARPVVLGDNYRCKAEILAAADNVIRNNKERIRKNLVARKGPGGHLSFRRFDDEYAEAVAAVESIAASMRTGRSGAVLARTNRILDPVEAVCRSHGVKYFRASGKSILNRPEGALMCTVLELVQKTKTNGLDAVLGFAGVGAQDLKTLHSQLGPSLEQRPKRELLEMGLAESSADTFRELMKRLAEWRDLCDRQLFGLVLEGVHLWMSRHAKSDAADRAIATTYNVLSRLHGTFSDRLAFLRRENNVPSPDALILTTMHNSKGLEWDHVCIIRAEETVVPNEKSTESEERRLFYVAMTRARDRLELSTAKKNPTSRFILEAGVS
ncbi:ATP-dependent helicase [Ralstonia nicotianae]|uniref:ATP-dependent helicase n=1 Tax=Ralstonia pseudosolanacearum TaxID=1310165 RepID=UPI002004A1BC|nr:ATP-dependent helicase [Ralstonia pseudosolanacearum]MCK4118418.1 ATP-dependent helicase [Ralstonia pseudosolanacearum]